LADAIPFRTSLTRFNSFSKSLVKRKSKMEIEINNMKGAMALSAFRAGVGGKPKWATFKGLWDSRKFWFSRADRFKAD
jgi:hypothetical protein